MAKTKSITRNENHDSSRTKRMMTYDNGSMSPWSDITHDVLFVVMMQLGVIDFVAFSGVCKLWRSLALSNRKNFMTSKPPMRVRIFPHARKTECHLKEFEGRKFKTFLPRSAFGVRGFIGLTCGYYIVLAWKTRDFLLVNPITRHELRFPAIPCFAWYRPFLIFSHSVDAWVFVILDAKVHEIWFCIAGTEAWKHVSSTFPIIDLRASKGKIYTLDISCRLCELRLNSEPKLTLLQTKNFPEPRFLYPGFVSWGENLYVMERFRKGFNKFLELDFGEMKWVSPDEKTIQEYAFFLSSWNKMAPIERGVWAYPYMQYVRYFNYNITDMSPRVTFFNANMWYYPHDCLNVNFIDE